MSSFTGESVIIPTIDELESISEVIRIICTTCPKEDIKDISIIYSKASTSLFIEELHRITEDYDDIVFNIAVQKGDKLSHALQTGVELAQGSHICFIGADMENDPNDISVMIELSKKNPEKIITGSRRLAKDGFAGYPKLKYLLNSLFQIYLRVFFNTKGSDVTYLFQSTPADILRNHKFLYPEAYVLEVALLSEINKIPTLEFPTRVSRRKQGSSHLRFKYYMEFMKATSTIFRRAMLRKEIEKRKQKNQFDK